MAHMDDEFKKMMQQMEDKVPLPKHGKKDAEKAQQREKPPKPKIKREGRVAHFFEGGEDHSERPPEKIIRAENGKDVTDMIECLSQWTTMAMTGQIRSITIVGIKGDADNPEEFLAESDANGRYLVMSNVGRGSQFSIGDIISAMEEATDRMKRQATISLAHAVLRGTYDDMPEAERPPMSKEQAEALIKLAELEEKLKKMRGGKDG